jgi:heme-degrading monooxygenase HmoA
MIAVIFEAEPASGRHDSYLDIAAHLRPLLDEVEGFISVERFQSLTNPGKLVSLSFFEDEAAVQRWREKSEHRAAQSAGRSGVFADYRLRVASVIRDYSLTDRAQVPERQHLARSQFPT